MTAGICYARFSPRPRADECESVEVQLDRCRAYCRAHDYELAGEYADRELSGSRSDNRPDLQAALDHVCRVKGVLVVTKLDRLARNARDADALLVDRLHKHDADLAIIAAQINTRSAIGKAFYQILAVFAELERAQIVERTSEAMLYHQANGRRMGRRDRCPFGARLDPENDSRLIDDPEEQAVIELIRSLRAEGMGAKAMTRALDAQGIDCRGHRWHDSTVRAILRRSGPLAEVS